MQNWLLHSTLDAKCCKLLQNVARNTQHFYTKLSNETSSNKILDIAMKTVSFVSFVSVTRPLNKHIT